MQEEELEPEQETTIIADCCICEMSIGSGDNPDSTAIVGGSWYHRRCWENAQSMVQKTADHARNMVKLYFCDKHEMEFWQTSCEERQCLICSTAKATAPAATKEK